MEIPYGIDLIVQVSASFQAYILLFIDFFFISICLKYSFTV